MKPFKQHSKSKRNTQLTNIRDPLNQNIKQDNLNETITITTQKQVQQHHIKQITYKNFFDFLKISMVLAISFVQIGFSMCQPAAVPIEILIKDFHINMDAGLAHGILLGLVPFGGIFGAMMNSFLVRKWKKKQIYYFIEILNIVSTILMQITNFYVLFIGRLILGVTCGMYPMLAPVMTKQLSPPSLRPMFGSFFSMARIIGMVVCFSLGVIFEVKNVNNYWRIIFALSGVIGFIQTLLVFLFVPNVPGDLLARGQGQKVKQIVQKYYRQKYVDEIVAQYQKDYLLQKNQSQQQNQDIDELASNKKRAFIMAIYLNILPQFMGINTIGLLSTTLMNTLYPQIALYTNMILNAFRIGPTLGAIFWSGKKFGRRSLYMISGMLLGLSNYLIVIGYMVQVKLLVIVFLFLFMFFFSLFFTPVNYAYPAQITPAHKVTIANIFNQAAMALSLLIPPIIIQKMNGNAYPVFLFFAIYITISMIYIFISLVQTKGKKYEQIIKQY